MKLKYFLKKEKKKTIDTRSVTRRDPLNITNLSKIFIDRFIFEKECDKLHEIFSLL